ncbi:MAG TPA: paraquat-inducible protein A [Crenalkalicoccus sp.]|nr:paraquat-inducible protein A [Crenalkalicoccus sp.]
MPLDLPPQGLAGCPDCGLIQRLPPLPAPGTTAACTRCGAVLRRRRADPLRRPLAFALAGLALFSVAATLPLLDLDLYGRVREATLAALPAALQSEGWWELALVVAATVLLLPPVRLLMLTTVLAGLHLGHRGRWLRRLYRWQAAIRRWAMPEVFMLGLGVAYSRLMALAEVTPGPALWATAAFMLAMLASDASMDEPAIWHAFDPEATAHFPGIPCPACGLVTRAAPGTSCPRCDAPLWPRKPASVTRTSALTAAAAMLYLPANLYPVMHITRLGRTEAPTILGGVQELLEAGMWPLAALVLVASIAVPVFKLVAIVLMLRAARRGPRRPPLTLTRLYRFIEFIGRWSMIDIFMLSTLVALVQAELLARIVPGTGALCFGSVVVLTMLASASFDPRLMWDAARR